MNLVIFINYSNQIPILLGLFGKENLEYQSTFDASNFESSNIQIYYHSKLDTRFMFFRDVQSLIDTPNDVYNQYDNQIMILEDLKNKNLLNKINSFNNIKKVFLWHYAELFDKAFLKPISDIKYDTIFSGSKRIELENNENFKLDLLMPFRYFRYYIGYYYLEELVSNMEVPKYNKNSPKLFSYVRAHNTSSWRSEFISKIQHLLEPKDSANDAYDLLYPKYKHFEAINDYIYCNFNLIFETINYRNSDEAWLTEKTYKGLFFGKPFMLIAPVVILNFLKERGFFILNFEFIDEITESIDIKRSFDNFANWLETESEENIEIRYNEYLEKSLNNRVILSQYLNDYSQNEEYFKKLLN